VPRRARAVNGVFSAFHQIFGNPADRGPELAGARMRSFLAALAVAVFLGAPAASAETRIFIIVSNADGYGVDRCLASGEKCGAAAATALCRAREFTLAVSYRKVERQEITGVIPASAGDCVEGICDHFVAIECTR
jgi:hypothetical protein